jgi:hypothetical protein
MTSLANPVLSISLINPTMSGVGVFAFASVPSAFAGGGGGEEAEGPAPASTWMSRMGSMLSTCVHCTTVSSLPMPQVEVTSNSTSMGRSSSFSSGKKEKSLRLLAMPGRNCNWKRVRAPVVSRNVSITSTVVAVEENPDHTNDSPFSTPVAKDISRRRARVSQPGLSSS